VDEIAKLRKVGPEEDKKEVEKIQSVLRLLAEIQERAAENDSNMESILRIDDLLKYMGGVKVEVLKDELCNILQDYDRKIG
jgi:type I site-specific restriction endonuclease